MHYFPNASLLVFPILHVFWIDKREIDWSAKRSATHVDRNVLRLHQVKLHKRREWIGQKRNPPKKNTVEGYLDTTWSGLLNVLHQGQPPS